MGTIYAPRAVQSKDYACLDVEGNRIAFLAQELPRAALNELGSPHRLAPSAVVAGRPGEAARLRALLTTAVRDSLPLVFLWLLQQSPLGQVSSLAGYGYPVAVIYLLVNLLSEVGPLYREKVEAVRGVLDLRARGG